jgi:protein-disulfide isomerase
MSGNSITAQQVRDTIGRFPELKKSAENSENVVPATDPPIATAQPTLPGNPAAIAGVSPGEQLYADFEKSAFVNVGSGKRLFMIINPECPHCKTTWKEFRDSVKQGKVQVALIPMAGLGSDAERAAAQLLSAPDPMAAWDRYVDGDAKALAGEAKPEKLQAVRSNFALADKWQVQATPYMAYRGRDGKVKIIQGKPKDMAQLLADLAP